MTPPAGVEFFYLGEGALQYFFPSRYFDSRNSELTMEGDWLYRTYALEEEDQPRTLFNFTLYSDTLTIKEVPEYILLTMDSTEVLIPEEHIEIIYVDQNKTRFTSWLTSEEMEILLSGEGNQLNLDLKWNQTYHFISTQKWLPQLEYFRDVLLESSSSL